MTKHKVNKSKKRKPSLRAHGRKHGRTSKGHRQLGGDSGFSSTLAGLTSIGHARGY